MGQLLTFDIELWNRHSEEIVQRHRRDPGFSFDPYDFPDVTSPVPTSTGYFTFTEIPRVRDAARSAFEEYLLAAADQRFARFSVFRFYSEAKRDSRRRTALSPAKATTAQWHSSLNEDFRYFTDWPIDIDSLSSLAALRWEQRQAYVALNWKQVERITDAMKTLDPESSVHFDLRLAGSLYHGLLSTPGNNAQVACERPVSLMGLSQGDFFSFPVSHFTEAEIHWLWKCAGLIQTAIGHDASLNGLWRAALAQCYFACGHFHEAAAIWETDRLKIAEGYEQVMRFDPILQGWSAMHPPTPEVLQWWLTDVAGLFVAECLDRAGSENDRACAIRKLEKLLHRFEDREDIHTKLYDLLRKENQYEEAEKHLAKVRELTPDDTRWKDPIADIASSAAYLTRKKQKDDYLVSTQNLKQREIIYRTLLLAWPLIERMMTQARGKLLDGYCWLCGTYCEDEWPMTRRADYAIDDLSRSVEWQLRTSLFDRFRSEHGSKLEDAAKGCRDLQMVDWRRFLLSGRLLSLGQMLRILEFSREGEHNLLVGFRQWLDKLTNRQWDKLLDPKFDVIVKMRNDSVHEPVRLGVYQLRDVEHFAETCRQFLTRLFVITESRRYSTAAPGKAQA